MLNRKEFYISDDLDFRILNVPTNNDKIYRDTLCMAYASSVLDLPMSDFHTGVKSTIKKDGDKELLIRIIQKDIEGRLNRLL